MTSNLFYSVSFCFIVAVNTDVSGKLFRGVSAVKSDFLYLFIFIFYLYNMMRRSHLEY